MRLPLVLAPLLLAAVLGCRGGASTKPLNMGSEDGQKIALVIEDMNDAKGDARKLTALFVPAAKPDAPKKFGPYAFYVVGKPSVSGTTATCKVRIDRADGTQAGETEWSFEKAGDAWKIKSAPLP
jgi:hypothetical protein